MRGRRLKDHDGDDNVCWNGSREIAAIEPLHNDRRFDFRWACGGPPGRGVIFCLAGHFAQGAETMIYPVAPISTDDLDADTFDVTLLGDAVLSRNSADANPLKYGSSAQSVGPAGRRKGSI